MGKNASMNVVDDSMILCLHTKNDSMIGCPFGGDTKILPQGKNPQ